MKSEDRMNNEIQVFNFNGAVAIAASFIAGCMGSGK